MDGNSDDFARQLFLGDRAVQLAFDQDVAAKTAGLAVAFGSLFLPGLEDLVFGAVAATRVGRAIGWVGDKLARAFGRGADDTLQKIFEVQRGKGNLDLGSMSGEKADKIGRAWVGDNAKPLMRVENRSA